MEDKRKELEKELEMKRTWVSNEQKRIELILSEIEKENRKLRDLMNLREIYDKTHRRFELLVDNCNSAQKLLNQKKKELFDFEEFYKSQFIEVE